MTPKTTPDGPTVQIIQEQLPIVGDNLLDLQLFRPGTGSRLLLALLEWETPSGEQHKAEHRLQVPQGRIVRYALPYRLAEAGIHRAALRLYDPERDTTIHAVEELRLFARPAWELSGDRSYYTVEDEIRFRLRRNRRADTTIPVTVELQRGEVLDRLAVNMIGQEVAGAFAADTLPAGRYELVARWLDPVGGADSLAVTCEKFAPAAREVKIDLFSQSLLVDGEPFFPIGLYWLRAEDPRPDAASALQLRGLLLQAARRRGRLANGRGRRRGDADTPRADRVRPAGTRAGLSGHCRPRQTLSPASGALGVVSG